MRIGGADGSIYRYEVFALAEGYVVQARDLDGGVAETGEARLFRTAAVAFAHAQAMAAIDRFAAMLLAMQDAAPAREEARLCERRFAALRERLADDGCFYAVAAGPAAAPLYH